MRVPLLDRKAQDVPLREEIRAAIDRVCDSQEPSYPALAPNQLRHVATTIAAFYAR